MNRPDKAGEQSMEEILASIRQIIADEPSSDRSDAVIDANPLVPKSSGAGGATPLDTRTPPLLDRLNGVLRNGSLPPTNPLGSKRPLSFDQDLADMFDEGDAQGAALAAPKPELSFSTASKSSASAEASDKPALNGAALLPPQLSASQPTSASSSSFVPPLPFGGSDSEAVKDVAPPAPRNFGFPPLRKQGFYPPQNAMPVLPPLPPVESSRAAAASPPESAEEKLKRLSGLGAVVPGEISSGSAQTGASTSTLFGSPVFSTPEAKPATEVRPASSSLDRDTSLRNDADVSTGLPALETPAPFRSAVAEPAFEAFGRAPDSGNGRDTPRADAEIIDASTDVEAELVEPVSFAPAPVVDVAPIDIAPVAPINPAPASKPAAATRPFSDRFSALGNIAPPPASPVVEPAPRFATAAPAAETAAAQALDALAQGLAASAAASAFAGVTQSSAQAAIPLTPIVEPAGAAGLPPVNALTPAPGAAGGAVPAAARTLEDAVADMLRPMLQQWVADNMPRIIEKALRNEVSNPVRPGSKPSGS
ncbi:DUF2497 domain-containing protein [Hyphomicrobium sp. LHD-15]|uniref:DUF2497 domain-containing protein n=1 Tax=Hyphomicrobium sp. LHD-15 TaxID=3072142 RepID=UPI00280F396E|nr:DUF2497 domain-containing protein [Hyphomicrobium sp. LHD-15]MDQ8700046.1 DUF2497 domain-containing protein [Hyphomicrobium sp. LHD-15]